MVGFTTAYLAERMEDRVGLMTEELFFYSLGNKKTRVEDFLFSMYFQNMPGGD